MITANYFGMVTICAGIFGVIKCQSGNCHFGHASLVALGAQLLTSYHFNWSTIHVSQLKILIEHTCLYRNYMRIHTCIKHSLTHSTHTHIVTVQCTSSCTDLISYCSIPDFLQYKISHFIYFYCFLHFDYELSVHSPELIISNIYYFQWCHANLYRDKNLQKNRIPKATNKQKKTTARKSRRREK